MKHSDKVRIKFLDSETIPGWTYPHEEEKLKETMYLHAVGYFLKKDKYFTLITMGFSDKGGFLNVQKIPNGCIVEIVKL